ncbi:MAG: glycogen debranching enzyme N-terminal domain-containing protein, partial [Kiritimatiellae bacterium]|nr:glycogen debranching enzyme N-terminal domain-containing protein [Kiritimatiellia bacterium]
KMIVYTPGKAQRTTSTLLIPPRSNCAKVVSALDHDRIRRNPDMRTILSNGAGASSQVRVAWGTIASQYDSLLAANPDANCPSDRLNLWARTRVWLQREGYAREVDMKCMTRFEADPAGKAARWTFNVPCGMGRSAAFTFELSLSEGFNAARLAICRIDGGEDDVRDQVRLVLRPDIEWRSFHANTKAFTGLETLFPAHTKPVDSGFEFAPYDKGFFSMRIDGGEYHHEPQWSYNVPHTEEADRGQEGAGDLYSPGWISADLKEGECVVLTGEAVGVGAIRKKGEKLRFPAFKGRGELLGIADAMRAAMDLYIVKRDDLKTVIAGYPWFLDWGRDTFIFMQGMLAAGMVEDSLCILKAFAAFEEKGTLPNIIYGKTAGNRDTADAQLWFIQSVKELVRLVGRDERYAEDLDSLRGTCAAIVDSYISGTPNGIRVDPESALVWCPSHFTWMDTNYPACTPRNGYPVEIQALWVSALEFLGRNLMSMTAKASIETYFKIETGGYCDCLDAPNGEAAAKARPDQAVRPNQLLLVTLGVVEDKSILEATEELLVPGAIRTLNASHSLYRGEYSGDEDTSRKPAYHNGTAWVWPFALYAEALVKTGMASKETALQLLAGVVEDLNSGTIGHLPEILDGDAPHAQKGCSAQAWSVSEILRVWLKLNG